MADVDALEIRLYAAQARISVLETLVLALFEACKDKPSVLKTFLTDTEEVNVRTLYSDLPEKFYESYLECRDAYEEMLRTPRAPIA